MSSETSPNADRTALIAAAERRAQQQASHEVEARYAQEHDKRQAFRRLIDPGILRVNSPEVAMVVLKTLSTVAENLLKEPDNPKYQKFKATNTAIKQRLIEPKGALEYAIALGFRAEVVEFQPYYVFNNRHMTDLRIGAAVLKEVLVQKSEQEERLSRWKNEEKEAAAAAQEKVKLAFMDDRKARNLLDQRERERREAKAAAAASAAPEANQRSPPPTGSPPPPSPPSYMPGSGHILSGNPPAYQAVGDDHE